MKWNILIGSLVMGVGLCANSFGFELLDQMLGLGGGVGDPVHEHLVVVDLAAALGDLLGAGQDRLEEGVAGGEQGSGVVQGHVGDVSGHRGVPLLSGTPDDSEA